MGGHKIIELNWTPNKDIHIGSGNERPLKLWLHLLLRMLPDASGPGMGFVEVLRRDTSADLVILEQNAGLGELTFRPWLEHEIDYCGLANLKTKEVISAQLTVSNWSSTEKNGWAQLVKRLL